MSDDFETTSGVTKTPSSEEVKAAPQSASANADETQEASEASEENDNAQAEDGQEDGQESEEGDPQEGDKRPKKNGFKKRIDKLNARNSALQAEIEQLKRAQGNGAQDTSKQNQETQVKAENGKPDPNSFETNAEYIEALTDWKLEQKEKASKQAAAEAEVKTAQQKLQSEHNERIQKFKEATPDFDQKVSEFIEEHGDIQIAPIVAEAIQTSKVSAEIIYSILNTPGEYQRLHQMNAVDALKEIGKHEAKVLNAKESSGSSKPIKKTTTAPKPMNPVGTPSKSEKSLDDMDFDEFMEARNKKGR